MLCVLGPQEKWLAKTEVAACLAVTQESVGKKKKTKVDLDVSCCSGLKMVMKSLPQIRTN